jgi:hypothetical protein
LGAGAVPSRRPAADRTCCRRDAPQAPDGVEVSRATRDAAADHERLRAAGVAADADVLRMGPGVPPMFTFRDPDGNRFRMVERD